MLTALKRLPLLFVTQPLVLGTGSEKIRRRFVTSAELIGALYAALDQFLQNKERIRFGPLDAAACRDAAMDDLSADKITRFLRIARRARGFPLAQDTHPRHVLEHLQLLNKGRRPARIRAWLIWVLVGSWLVVWLCRLFFEAEVAL